MVLKWLLAVVIVTVILSVALPRAGRFGRMPGDLRIPVRGRVVYIPLASTVLLSLLVWALAKLL
jgi:DUF2905 family protein